MKPSGTRPSRRSMCRCVIVIVVRSGVLPVHGHALPKLYSPEEGQVWSQTGARIHPQLQAAAGLLQKSGRRQGESHHKYTHAHTPTPSLSHSMMNCHSCFVTIMYILILCVAY